MVGVMDHPVRRAAVPDSHVHRADDQVGRRPITHRPADDHPGEGIDHDGQVEPAFIGGVLRQIADPQIIWNGRFKSPPDKIGTNGARRIPAGAASQPAANGEDPEEWLKATLLALKGPFADRTQVEYVLKEVISLQQPA